MNFFIATQIFFQLLLELKTTRLSRDLVERHVLLMLMLDAVINLFAAEVVADPEEPNTGGSNSESIGGTNDSMLILLARMGRNSGIDLIDEIGPLEDGSNAETNRERSGASQAAKQGPETEEEGKRGRSSAVTSIEHTSGVNVLELRGEHDSGDEPEKSNETAGGNGKALNTRATENGRQRCELERSERKKRQERVSFF